MHHIETGGKKFLLDCGLYQGRRQEAFARNSNFPFPAASIDSVILSHAHMDHSGNLPTLFHNGFRGPIYTTPATIDLCLAMLADSAHIQQSDAEFCNRRRGNRKAKGLDDRECTPLYTVDDAAHTYPLFTPVQLNEKKEVSDALTYRTYDAGHMLGSTAMILEADGTRLAFSGDVGRVGIPILRDPQPLDAADYLIMECTYGDRLHAPIGHAEDRLADVVNRTAARGGKIIIPCFAVGRTQQVVLMLHNLMEARRIPSIPMFVDSPLAINVTEVYRKHPETYDQEAQKFLDENQDPFAFSRLTYVREASESKKLNDLHGPAVILASSGMMEAGRVLHHLRNNIEDPRNTILITGFQAPYTLGRKILDHQPEVPIFGEPMTLRAEVVSLEELSGHADEHELIEWMRPFAKGLKKVFLVHGETAPGAALAALITKEYGIEAHMPARGETVSIP
jgi:metallo-beta-lactamase family protein